MADRKYTEKFIPYALLVATSISSLFCLISIIAPGWNGLNIFSIEGRSAAAALCLVSLLLLIGCTILLFTFILNLSRNNYLPITCTLILIVTSIFLLGILASFFSGFGNNNYSLHLIITTFTFTYLASFGALSWSINLSIVKTPSQPVDMNNRRVVVYKQGETEGF